MSIFGRSSFPLEQDVADPVMSLDIEQLQAAAVLGSSMDEGGSSCTVRLDTAVSAETRCYTPFGKSCCL